MWLLNFIHNSYLLKMIFDDVWTFIRTTFVIAKNLLNMMSVNLCDGKDAIDLGLQVLFGL